MPTPPKTDLHPAPRDLGWRTRPAMKLDRRFENSRGVVHGMGRALPIAGFVAIVATAWCVYLATLPM